MNFNEDQSLYKVIYGGFGKDVELFTLDPYYFPALDFDDAIEIAKEFMSKIYPSGYLEIRSIEIMSGRFFERTISFVPGSKVELYGKEENIPDIDEYIRGSQTERAAYLTKRFGRKWIEVQELLALTSRERNK